MGNTYIDRIWPEAKAVFEARPGLASHVFGMYLAGSQIQMYLAVFAGPSTVFPIEGLLPFEGQRWSNESQKNPRRTLDRDHDGDTPKHHPGAKNNTGSRLSQTIQRRRPAQTAHPKTGPW
eukprot:scaffold106466_cov22-Tisochrysis_lutea.AAC.1